MHTLMLGGGTGSSIPWRVGSRENTLQNFYQMAQWELLMVPDWQRKPNFFGWMTQRGHAIAGVHEGQGIVGRECHYAMYELAHLNKLCPATGTTRRLCLNHRRRGPQQGSYVGTSSCRRMGRLHMLSASHRNFSLTPTAFKFISVLHIILCG
jgi:hypothetical protein